MTSENRAIPAAGPAPSLTATGLLDVSKVALRVMPRYRGDTVDREDVSRRLGCASDPGPFVHWRLRAPDSVGSELDGQIAWILERLTADLEQWKAVNAAYRIDVFCGLFLEQTKRGLGLLPKTLADLGAREIEVVFDIYVPAAPGNDE
ncbi:MAG: DUF4279 domain-containing protein [Opitutaceae bacterium]